MWPFKREIKFNYKVIYDKHLVALESQEFTLVFNDNTRVNFIENGMARCINSKDVSLITGEQVCYPYPMTWTGCIDHRWMSSTPYLKMEDGKLTYVHVNDATHTTHTVILTSVKEIIHGPIYSGSLREEVKVGRLEKINE